MRPPLGVSPLVFSAAPTPRSQAKNDMLGRLVSLFSPLAPAAAPKRPAVVDLAIEEEEVVGFNERPNKRRRERQEQKEAR